MSSVSLDSGQLAAARQAVTVLASSVEAQRHAVSSGTPVSLPTLHDGGPAQQASVWLEEQVAGLQSLEDLARLLETTGGTASYDGTGSFEGVGGTGLLDAFTSLVPVGPESDATLEEVHQWWLALSPLQQLAATLVQSRTYGNTDGIPAQVHDLANRKNLPVFRQELLGMLEDPASYDPDTADHVSVFTPGFTSNVQDSLSTYDADMYDLQVKAAQQSRMYGDSGTVATVTWLGYDAPQLNEITDWPRSVTMPDLAEADGDPVADLGGVAPFGVDPSHMDGVDFLSTHEGELPDGARGAGSPRHSEYLKKDSTAQYTPCRHGRGPAGEPPGDRGRTAPVPGGPSDRRLLQLGPGVVHQGCQTGRAAVEVTGEIVEDGLEHAWDAAKDFRLHNPVVHVPW